MFYLDYYIIMEGSLLKWTNFFSGWKERYFVLKGPILYYYYNKSEKPKGRIHLGISTIISEENNVFFEINTGSNIFFFKAHSQEERDNWLQAIKISKLEGENQIKNSANINIKSSNSYNNTSPNLDSLSIAITKLTIDNQTLQDLINKTSENKSAFHILLERYREDVEELKRTLNQNNNNKSNQQELMPVRGKAYQNNNNNNNNEINRNTFSKENEMFYDFEDENDFDDDYNSEININTSLLQKIQKDPTIHSNTMNSQITSVNTKKQLSSFSHSNTNDNGKEYFDPLYNYQKRTQLPLKRKDLKINVWQFFKSAVGKDVNRFAVPVFFNEPLSMLQKLCENFQYAYLFNKAAVDPSPYMRLAYCACFCIGGFVMNIHRTTKFFNPILMETYEYIDNEQNFRYFAEQVSHHPAISACYAEGKGWNFYTNNNAILNFLITGKLEITNVGRCYVNFSNFNESIVFTKPLCVVRNLIFGTIILDMVGKFTVTNEKGDICEVEMIPSTSGQQGNVTGTVKDLYGNVYLKFGGNWLDNMYVIDPQTNEKKVLWTMIPSSDQYSYYFQPYSFDLNNLTEDMKNALPPTDSRFRPDQRLMEMQEIDEAGEEKHRLEEKQRKARKENQKEGIIPRPMYFDETYDDITGELIYKYKGNYFEDRKNKNFGHFPDIF